MATTSDTRRSRARTWERHKRRMVAYGRWEPWADAEPVRQHMHDLAAAGVGVRRLAELSGVPYNTLAYVRRERPQRVKSATADAVLAIQVTLNAPADHAFLDATGTRRRLQALAIMGWPWWTLADRVGLNIRNLQALGSGESQQVYACTARAVVGVYNQLWNVSGPSPTTAKRAKTKNWASALAWDDDKIDDPHAKPDFGAETHRYVALVEDAAEVRQVEGFDTLDQVADRLGVHVRTIQRAWRAVNDTD